MGKVAVLILLAIAVWIGFRLLARQRRSRSAGPVEPMVACAHCAVHVPRSEAFEARGRFYCSEEHRSLPPRS
jgi:uncharacterized protein